MFPSFRRRRARSDDVRSRRARKLPVVLAMTGAALMAAIVPGGSASAATGAAQQVPFDITGWLVNEYSHLCATPSFNFGSLLNFIAQEKCYQSNQLVDLVPRRIVNGVQLFEIVIVSSGTDTGKCYDLANYGGVAPGTLVEVYPCNSVPRLDNQEWFAVYRGVWSDTPTYTIQNYASNGLCLDVSGWASAGSDTAPGKVLTVYPCYDAAWGNFGWDDHLWWFDG